MNTKTVFTLFIVLFALSGGAQEVLQQTARLPQTAGRIKEDPSPQASSSFLLDVLFASNSDCILFINGEEREVVSKNAFAYLKLSPGRYRLAAKSQATGDVYSDTFSVAATRLNEVFIDMLYAIDLENEKRTSLKKTAPPATGAGQQVKTAPSGAAGNARTEKEKSAVNALLANMVTMPAGSFVMGNNKAPAADEAEHPVLLNGFSMGKYEVTQEQWESIMGFNPSINRGCTACPVENVSWEEVMRFIRRLNSITNRRFRLPTEAEWEYVARRGGREEIEKAGGPEAYIGNTAWSSTNSGNKTQPVGKKEPTAGGVYDLYGNVSEWCMDWYGAFFYREDDTEKNPEGPPLGKEKIIRGGNYKDYVGDRFRPSFRNKMNPKSKGGEVGFRLVLD